MAEPLSKEDLKGLVRDCIGEECNPRGALSKMLDHGLDRIKTEIVAHLPPGDVKAPGPPKDRRIGARCATEGCPLHPDGHGYYEDEIEPLFGSKDNVGKAFCIGCGVKGGVKLLG